MGSINSVFQISSQARDQLTPQTRPIHLPISTQSFKTYSARLPALLPILVCDCFRGQIPNNEFLVFSLDNIDTSFNAASQEAVSKPQQIPEAQESTPAPVTLSLDSIAPGTIISDGGINSFELVVANGVRKLVPVMLSCKLFSSGISS